MLEVFSSGEAWISLATLTLLEIVLGIDNIVFITILAGKLLKEEQGKARRLGLAFALLSRLALLAAISWIVGLTAPVAQILGRDISWRDVILLAGGLFLIGKATFEIHDKLEVAHPEEGAPKNALSLWAVISQIIVLDVVFSLDSVITAVGMARHLSVMMLAVVLAVGVMLIFAGAVGEFIERHPTMKILALSFLILIGVALVADGLGQHLDKRFIYFAMAFSLGVEILNMRLRARHAPLALHHRFEEESPARRA